MSQTQVLAKLSAQGISPCACMVFGSPAPSSFAIFGDNYMAPLNYSLTWLPLGFQAYALFPYPSMSFYIQFYPTTYFPIPFAVYFDYPAILAGVQWQFYPM